MPLLPTQSAALVGALRPRSAGSLRLLPLAAIILPLVILCAGAFSTWTREVAEAEREMNRSAMAGAQYLARALEGYRAGLARANDSLHGQTDAQIRANAESLTRELARIVEELPQSALAYVIDRHGAPLLISNLFPAPPADFRDRDYFRAMVEPAAPPIHVSELFTSRFENRLLFSIVRRRSGSANPDAEAGGFDGVILLSIDPSVIARDLQSLAAEPSDLMLFVNRDRRVLSRSTGPVAPGEHALLMAPEEPGWARLPDGTRAITAVRELPDFGVTIISARPDAHVLAQWWSVISGYLLFGIPAGLAMFFLSLRVRAAHRRLEEANVQLEAALRQGSDRLSRIKRFGLVGTFEHDLGTGVSRRSAEYMSLHRRSPTPAEESHADWVRRLHPDDRNRAEAELLRTLADPQAFTYGQTYRTLGARRRGAMDHRAWRDRARPERPGHAAAWRSYRCHAAAHDRACARRKRRPVAPGAGSGGYRHLRMASVGRHHTAFPETHRIAGL